MTTREPNSTPRLRQRVAPLVRRATESLTLAVELFNRPSEVARAHGVLLLLHHSFEMLLKAVVLSRMGRTHDRKTRLAYSFDECLTIAAEHQAIDGDERATLAILKAQRDQVAHYYVEVSEDVLYIHAQSAVTLFGELLRRSFERSLQSYIPERILPVSARPPRDISKLFMSELADIDNLLEGGKRQGERAAARLRSLMAFISGARGNASTVSERELATAVSRRRKSEPWDVILPEFAQLRLSTEGAGVPITMRIEKDAPLAVRIARPGEKVVGTVVNQEIDIWEEYNMSRDDLAASLGFTGPRTHALIYELDLQSDPACYKMLTKGGVTLKGYSKRALEKLLEAKGRVDMAAVWERHKFKLGAVRSKTRVQGVDSENGK